MILLPETGGTHAKDIAERIRTKNGEDARRPARRKGEISFAISLGVACYPTCGREGRRARGAGGPGPVHRQAVRAGQGLPLPRDVEGPTEKDPDRITAMLNENVESSIRSSRRWTSRLPLARSRGEGGADRREAGRGAGSSGRGDRGPPPGGASSTTSES